MTIDIETKRHNLDKWLYDRLTSMTLPNDFENAVQYAVKAGGKRLRPILLHSAFNAFSNDDDKIIDVMLALELIHTYSLIHDDLPAMDDDDLRRGMPTIHKEYDEATAILVGDGFLTYAFQIISNSPHLAAEEKVYVTQQLSQASGFDGMIQGQYLDLKAENQTVSLDELETIHRFKTGALIRAAVKIGAYLGGAVPPQIESLDRYASYLGLIFQVQDDILDVTGDEEALGKPVGSDESLQKSTYPSLLGLEGAQKWRDECMNKATKALQEANVNHDELQAFIQLFGRRNH
ncbi:geranylgeranyl diphosphate synthase type II [Alkalibacillus flavidus]|uniref:Geranylgeranyl diphosphate synthase type II n=1 Tax=Alkalibacillus flavidus TaxID=546021 RepID=A0ABV2KYV9_9BACI